MQTLKLAVKVVTLTWLTLFTSASESKQKTDNLMLLMNDKNESQYWRSVNDNVMGGISQGGMSFNNKHASFSGQISLENNGGFSSVTRFIDSLPTGTEQIKIKMDGDGKTYQFRLAMWQNGYRITYRQEFNTDINKTSIITLPLEDFVATFRGRTIWNAPKLNADLIREIGFLITTKKAEPFQLNVHSIEFI